jgi:hypothetical protein
MRFSTIYRGLLLLYPADFRRQFSAEMICVFEQRAGERFANTKSATFAFLLTEFSSLVTGAYTMWLAKILPIKRNCSHSNAMHPSVAPLTVADAMKQRDAAIKNMVTSIAEHDFINARRYSEEETRLKNLLKDLENEVRVGQSDQPDETASGEHPSLV